MSPDREPRVSPKKKRPWFVLFNPDKDEPLQVSKSTETLAMSAWSHHRIVEVQVVGEPMAREKFLKDAMNEEAVDRKPPRAGGPRSRRGGAARGRDTGGGVSLEFNRMFGATVGVLLPILGMAVTWLACRALHAELIAHARSKVAQAQERAARSPDLNLRLQKCPNTSMVTVVAFDRQDESVVWTIGVHLPEWIHRNDR